MGFRVSIQGLDLGSSIWGLGFEAPALVVSTLGHLGAQGAFGVGFKILHRKECVWPGASKVSASSVRFPGHSCFVGFENFFGFSPAGGDAHRNVDQTPRRLEQKAFCVGACWNGLWVVLFFERSWALGFRNSATQRGRSSLPFRA